MSACPRFFLRRSGMVTQDRADARVCRQDEGAGEQREQTPVGGSVRRRLQQQKLELRCDGSQPSSVRILQRLSALDPAVRKHNRGIEVIPMYPLRQTELRPAQLRTSRSAPVSSSTCAVRRLTAHPRSTNDAARRRPSSASQRSAPSGPTSASSTARRASASSAGTSASAA